MDAIVVDTLPENEDGVDVHEARPQNPEIMVETAGVEE